MDQVLIMKAQLSLRIYNKWWFVVVTIVKQALLMRNTDNNTVHNFKNIFCKNTES